LYKINYNLDKKSVIIHILDRENFFSTMLYYHVNVGKIQGANLLKIADNTPAQGVVDYAQASKRP
jgi:hypothetical protein